MNLFTRLALLLALAAPAPLSAQPPSAAAATNHLGPRIQFNTENYNFGKVLVGHPIKYIYIATNTGDLPLTINNAHGSCSCTVVGNSAGKGWTPRLLAPHETCLIPIEIATSNFKGPIAKTVTVTSTDPTRPIVTLSIHGEVWVPIEVSPPAAYFSLMPDARSAAPATLHIVSKMDEPLTLSPPVSTTNAFFVELRTNIPGKDFSLVITPEPASRLPAAPGTTLVQGAITMKTSVPDMPLLSVSVMATIQPEVMVAPIQIMLPGGPLAQPMTNWVTIRGNTTNALTLSDPEISVPGPNVSIRVMQTNRTYNLIVAFPKGFEIKPGENIMVSVKSDNPRYPNINIPVMHLSPMSQPGRLHALYP